MTTLNDQSFATDWDPSLFGQLTSWAQPMTDTIRCRPTGSWWMHARGAVPNACKPAKMDHVALPRTIPSLVSHL